MPTSFAKGKGQGANAEGAFERRLRLLKFSFVLLALGALSRLFLLQVVSHDFYEALAAGTHEVFENLVPARGDILLKDRDGSFYPVATNKDTFQIFAEPRNVKEKERAVQVLSEALALPSEELEVKLSGSGLYTPLARGIEEAAAETLKARLREEGVSGIKMAREATRIYPEEAMGGQVLGFVGADSSGEKRGRYGIERAFDRELAGEAGSVSAERDIAGRWIPVAARKIAPGKDGADIVLTIDRAIQVFACERLAAAVKRHGADGGALVIMDPQTGFVLAMCGAPDFDPNRYFEVKDISVFNNPAVVGQYEPGSVMKPITLAAAIDAGKIGPKTTYEDTGEVRIDTYTLKNSDGKANGVQSMTDVLEKSLNTGAIFAMRSMGKEALLEAFQKFGFGSATGIDLPSESAGTLESLKKKGEIYAATASYGQGMTATPLQLAAAFGAIANGGKLMRPNIVAATRPAEGELEERKPELLREVIAPRTAALLGGMLTAVVENGHGKRAQVPGYWIAGKTGTAQVPKKDGPGYDPDLTIGSFVGFGPVEDPAFVMVVRIDHPRDVRYAESSAAPLFGEIAKFLLQYLHVPPSR